MEDFVLRPGRSLVLWSGRVLGARFRVESDVAVSVMCEDDAGVVQASVASRAHDILVKCPRKTPLRLRVQNVSGTRKARGNVQVTDG